MADEAMNVIDAGKTIAGLMSNQTTEQAPATEETEAPVEAVEENQIDTKEDQDDDTINPSDVPYMNQEETPDENIETATENEAEQDIDESSEEPFYRVKVQGQELEVTLDELLQGYQREADYTRSKQDLSLERSRYNDLLKESQTEINQKLSKLNELTSAAQSQLNAEYGNIDFEQLYEDDPVEASKLEHKMRKRAENLERIQYETMQAQNIELKKHIENEQRKVVQLIPDFANPQKSSVIKGEMKNLLSKYGFNEQEINTVYDHRQVLLIKDALAYDKIRKANPKVKKKVVNAPKVIKSGTSKRKAEIDAKLKANKLNRLRKTGEVKDAAKLFRDLL